MLRNKHRVLLNSHHISFHRGHGKLFRKKKRDVIFLTIWLQLWTQTHFSIQTIWDFMLQLSSFECSDTMMMMMTDVVKQSCQLNCSGTDTSIRLLSLNRALNCIINTFWIEESDQCTYSPLILPEEYADLHMWPWSCLSAVDFLSAAICHSTLSTTSLMAFSSSVWTVWSTAWTGHERFCFMSSSICHGEH